MIALFDKDKVSDSKDTGQSSGKGISPNEVSLYDDFIVEVDLNGDFIEISDNPVGGGDFMNGDIGSCS